MYEYIIARTKYIDAAFIQALKQDFDQVVIFGAGLDSRELRFQDINQATKIFELDAPITQRGKLKSYQVRKLNIPDNLLFVTIDFNKENLADKIKQDGVISGMKTLFILEGVIMYLSAEAVDSTFRIISEVSQTGSLVVFDYIHGAVLWGENRYSGGRDAAKRVAKLGEAWTFSLEETEVESFLDKYNIRLQDHSRTQDLENRYFRNSKVHKRERLTALMLSSPESRSKNDNRHPRFFSNFLITHRYIPAMVIFGQPAAGYTYTSIESP